MAGTADRAERALVAYVRQELSAPVTAIVGYAEMLVADAARVRRTEAIDDLAHVLDASRTLHRLVLPLLEPAATRHHEASPGEFRRKLRHDLRTPINAIKGYSEILREDAIKAGTDGFVGDLDKILREVDLLIDRIDRLVTPTGDPASASHGACAVASDPPSIHVVENLVASMRAVERDEADLAAAFRSRILVVDDNVSNRDLLARRLQRQGHTVLEAEDGAGALAMVEAEPPDLVMLDLMMPGISGYEVLVRLKADPRHRDIPVIMISALNELDSVVRCIEAGADDYLAKPFDPTLLRARVGSSLEKKHMRDREREMVEALRGEKERSEQLLLNILPRTIVTRLNGGEAVIADHHPEATILFADIVGFTRIASRLPAADVVRLLNGLFSEFDRLAVEHGLEKIKTVGDNYMLAGGLPDHRPDHARAVVDVALAMLDLVERRQGDLPGPVQMRIGIHSGDVVAGVIGTHKFLYDIWGDTVNIASRMESHGVPGRIVISAQTCGLVRGHFLVEPRGMVDIKGMGPMESFILLGPVRPPAS